MKNNLNKSWREFILNEGKTPDIAVWIQSLKESLSLIKPRSLREDKRLELMRHQLNEIKRASNRLQREIKTLQEENQVLKEQNKPKE